MEQELTSTSDQTDCANYDSNSTVDAFAAVVLVLIFVAASIFWISGQ